MAFIYGIFYSKIFSYSFRSLDDQLGMFTQLVFITTMPDIFINIYDESIGIMGLNYFALGLGLAFASWVNSKTMDKIYLYYKNKNNGVGEPEYRVRAYHIFVTLMSDA